MIDNTSGKRWARFALVFGAGASILGNETHTVITPSPVNILIRVVLAFVWPFALFVGIEVLVRVNWRAKFIDHAGRVLLVVPVSTVAAVVSYQHLHALMTLGGEDPFSAAIGPLAIDGLMIGGTVALLAIRAASLAVFPELVPVLATVSVPTEQETAPAITAEKKERTPRRRTSVPTEDQCEGVRLLLEGVKPELVAEKVDAGVSTVRRWARVIRLVSADRNAAIDPKSEHVGPELISYIREQVTR